MRKVILFFASVLLISACKEKRCDSFPDISDIDFQLELEDLTDQIHGLSSRQELDAFLGFYPVLRDEFFKANQYGSREEMLDQTWQLLQNQYVDTLYREVKRLFDVEKFRAELENAYKRISYFYPEFKPPKVQTVYSGFGKDIFFTDSLLVIGLDYYLGPKAKFRPDEYEYLKTRLTPDHLVPQLIQFTSNKYNQTNLSQRTILDEMVFYGKALYFTKQMLPCTPDSLIIGYSGQQIANSELSEGYLWAYFVENALLYDRKPLNIAKFIEERPTIPEIDRVCPGRIGQWLGWQIVEEYESQSSSDFKEIMTQMDSREVLMQSRYKPRTR